jgi:hypothetical protein
MGIGFLEKDSKALKHEFLGGKCFTWYVWGGSVNFHPYSVKGMTPIILIFGLKVDEDERYECALDFWKKIEKP